MIAIIKLILTILILKTSFYMQNYNFESLLGTPVSNVTNFIGDDFENKLFQKNFYYTKYKDEVIYKKFYGMSFNCVSLQTDEKEIIEAITVHFSSVTNRAFYDQMIATYGTPNQIKIIDKRVEISRSKSTDDTFNQEMSQGIIELREGTYEENPLYIIWEKENYTITIFSRYKNGISEVIFKKNVKK